MKVVALKKSRNELEFELEGEGPTFCNLLQETLSQEAGVELAGYRIPHPLTPTPIVYIRTREKDAKETLLKTAKEIEGKVEEFLKAWKEEKERSA
jgi:DNA-directed RNA polymerase subunit L